MKKAPEIISALVWQLLCGFCSGVLIACSADNSEFYGENSFNSNPTTANRSLYVASGACYAGGTTTSTGSATVARYDLTTGQMIGLVVDYNQLSPGDQPVGIVDYDSENLLVLVENTAGRRVDLVRKDGSSLTSFLLNSSALSGVMRSLHRLSDGSLLMSKSTAIEKFSPSKARITQGANPFVNNPAAPCSTTNTAINGVATLSNGKILYAHHGASPNNKLILISASGYSTAADCLANQAAPSATALPTGVLVHSSGKVLVPYGSTTAASNLVYSYSIDPTTNVVSDVTSAFSDFSIINGPSAIAEDTVTGEVFVANGNSAFNNVEKFTFDSTTGTLTHVPGPFLRTSVFTRCISAMKVMSDP